MTKGELIDDILERLQVYSDDSEISPLHISFLIDEARKMFIKQRYSKANKQIPAFLFQRINMELDTEYDNEFNELDTVLSTKTALPTLIENSVVDSNIMIDNGSYADIKFILIDLDRLPYVGYNRLLRDVVYVAIGYDYKLKLKGLANRYKLLENIRVRAVFEDPQRAWELSKDYSSAIDYLDVEYPIDSDMGVLIADFIIKQLIDKLKVPIDVNNNASEN